MSDNKKYYYLKLKDNFYDSEEMIILQNMTDGYLYSDILLKLYLRSLKNNGKLMFKDVIPYTPEVLAQVVRHQVGTVEKAVKIFKQLGLIEILDNGAIYMTEIQNFIGQSSTEADRKRTYRTRIKEEQKLLNGQMSDKCPDKNPPEIEIDIERDIDIDIELELNNKIYAQNDVEILEKWETDFNNFYQLYPRKVQKQNVKKWFKKNKPNKELFELMMNKLKEFIDSKEWQKNNGQFIPYPTTWLNQKRWEDEDIIVEEKMYDFKNFLKGLDNENEQKGNSTIDNDTLW